MKPRRALKASYALLFLATLLASFGLTASVSGAATTSAATTPPQAPALPPPPPNAFSNFTAQSQPAAIAASEAYARANGQSVPTGAPVVHETVINEAVQPDTTTPIDTVIGPQFADECYAYAEFGNYDDVAFGKSEIYNNGYECGITDQILAYNNGSYEYGNVAVAAAGTGWTNPQSLVPGYSVLEEGIQMCGLNPSNIQEYCTTYYLYAV
jgi:hypothetical protein